MTPERWDQIKEVLGTVLPKGPAERAAYLAELQASDPGLHRDVETILSYESADSFLEHPVIGHTELRAGASLGPYRVLGPLGSGGMGEVHRALDTTLNREVALKVLPDAFARDGDRLARFDREAKVLASLSHPNIAAIYGLEERGAAGGQPPVRALVLELVDGPTLADRIAQGPIPLDEALPIVRQIAEALEAAHEQAIVHRDLKPANIKLRPDGTVKLLDFGLAKALGREAHRPGSPGGQTGPTITSTGELGVLLGTAAYISPEQATGKTADRRADIWALGVVLWEMLTGRRPFRGDSASEVVAAVLTAEPDWSALPPNTPVAIRRLLRRCLVKSRRDRLQHVGDVRVELDDALTSPDELPVPSAPPAPWQRPASIGVLLVGTALMTAIVVGTLADRGAEPSEGVTRMSIVLPPTQRRTVGVNPMLAISPTGMHVTYVANGQIYVRALSELESRPLVSTAGTDAMAPFFSWDGEWIGFYSFQDDELQKVALAGGPTITLCECEIPLGASWGPDDMIVFGRGPQGILRVPGVGGTPEVLVPGDPERPVSYPQLLAGGEAVLYTETSLDGSFAPRAIVERLATGDRTEVVEDGTAARYVPTGHLVYALERNLMAVPFDLERLQATGSAVALVEGIDRGRTNARGAVNADLSETGTLTYLASDAGGARRTLVWVDRDGNEAPLAAPPRAYQYPRISPDGTQVALDVRDEEGDIWIWDLGREVLRRLTVETSSEQYAEWTPDSRRIVFSSTREGVRNLYWRAADGTGAVERLTESPNEQYPHTVSPDGAWLVFREHLPETRRDLYVLSLDDERRAEAIVVSDLDDEGAEIAPNGRWLAYHSSVSGQPEVYVQPFPDVGTGRWQISVTGGAQPLWSPDGRELFYRTQAGVMAVPVETGTSFSAGTPELIIDGARYYSAGSDGRTYAIAPDGERFLMIRHGDPDDAFGGLMRINVVLNWTRELLAQVPVS